MKIEQLVRAVAPVLLIQFKRQAELFTIDNRTNAKKLRDLKQRRNSAEFPGGFDQDIADETRWLAEDRKELAALKIAIKSLTQLTKE